MKTAPAFPQRRSSRAHGCSAPARGSRPRPAAFALALASLLLAVGCGRRERAPAGAGTEPDAFPRDTLVIASMADADTLISVVSQTAADGNIIDTLNYGLIDAEFDCRLVPRPALAKSFSWSEDGTVLRMELRDDIAWSDGAKVTAADILFTMDLVADPRVASPRLAYIEHMLPGKRPLVLDDRRIEWHFTHAYDRDTQLAHASALALLPRHILEKADRATLRGHPFNTQPVVNGRWKLGAWSRGERILLEPNDAWTGAAEDRPRLRRVIFLVLPEYASRLVALETGSVDMMEAIQIPDADRLIEEHPEITLHRRGWRFMDYVAWNALDPANYKARLGALAEGDRIDLATVNPHPLFGQKAVRVALARAIDTQRLIRDLLTSDRTGEVYGRPAVGTITPELCDVHNDDIAPLACDPAAARAELAALGWGDSNGDGVLDRNGRPFRFTLMTNSGNPRRARAAVIIQANLRDIGVAIEIEQVESNTFFERLRKKDYQAALSGWSAALFVDPTEVWHSGAEYEFNFTSYANPEVDRLIDEGMREPDRTRAITIWRRMQELIYADQPYAFLYWMDEIVGLHERFEDERINVLSPFTDLHKWWVPADKVKYPR